ncbi:MAG: DUF3515 domain-containing protein, partial [Pseudonocardiaceae bacterium]
VDLPGRPPDLSVLEAAPPPAPSRWLLGIALALPAALIVGVLVTAAVIRSQHPGPLPLATIAAPAADSADCVHLLAALPQELDGDGDQSVHRRQVAALAPAAQAPAGAAAWGEPPVVLRCGLGRPAALMATSRLLDVSGVQFLPLPPLGNPGTGAGSWVAVDRPVYVVVTLPPEAGSGPLQQIAGVISQTLPGGAVDVPR